MILPPDKLRIALESLCARIFHRLAGVSVQLCLYARTDKCVYSASFLVSSVERSLDLCIELPTQGWHWIEADLLVGGTGDVLAETGELPVVPALLQNSESLVSVINFIISCEERIVTFLLEQGGVESVQNSVLWNLCMFA